MKIRKVPLRICIGCQEQKSKKELVRIVRTPEGNIEMDLTGKKAGRGTYICPRLQCLDFAIKGKRIERNLKQAVSPTVVAELSEQLSKKENNA